MDFWGRLSGRIRLHLYCVMNNLQRKQARTWKAKSRQIRAAEGIESVTFDCPRKVMAALRAAAPLHPSKQIKGVLVAALESYAKQTAQGTQDLATLAVEFWPKIRPLLPYIDRLSNPTAPPIMVLGKYYSHKDVAPLIPVYRDLVLRVRNLGHTNYLPYLDQLVGLK